MRHRKKVVTTGRRPDHLRAMLANQVCSLIYEKRIETTVTKAKEVRRLAEKMVTLGKRGSLHHRRLAIAKLHQVDAVRVLFDEIAPGYMNRDGGYTRIIRLGRRRGDSAPTCYLEFVGEQLVKKEKRVTPPLTEPEPADVEEESTEAATDKDDGKLSEAQKDAPETVRDESKEDEESSAQSHQYSVDELSKKDATIESKEEAKKDKTSVNPDSPERTTTDSEKDSNGNR